MDLRNSFPLTREARREKLREIQKSSTVVTTMKLPGKGWLKVYKIPLQYLSYNPYNTRFLAQAKTLEKRLGCSLDDENPEHVREIEKFILEEKKDKNNDTINSLLEDGQIEPGVVTNDGVILSGNRRFRLLNEITRNRDKYDGSKIGKNNLESFLAAILNEDLSQKDIASYESYYQYGIEEKVDYSAIQKYLAANDRLKKGFSKKDIARSFGESERKVDEWLETFEYMDEYLEYIGEPGIYTALEGREEAFLNLRATMNSFKSGRAGNNAWDFKDTDLADLRFRYFDYIRRGTPTFDFRIFKDIFSIKDVWTDFNKEVENIVDGNDIKSFEDYRSEHPSLDEQTVSKMRSNDFKDQNGEKLDKVYGDANRYIINFKEEESPGKIVRQIRQKLAKLEEKIESGDEDDFSDEFIESIREIQKVVGRIKQRVD